MEVHASVLHCKYCTVIRKRLTLAVLSRSGGTRLTLAVLHRSGGMKPGCLPSNRGRTHDLHWLSCTDTEAHDLLWLSCTEAGVRNPVTCPATEVELCTTYSGFPAQKRCWRTCLLTVHSIPNPARICCSMSIPLSIMSCCSVEDALCAFVAGAGS